MWKGVHLPSVTGKIYLGNAKIDWEHYVKWLPIHNECNFGDITSAAWLSDEKINSRILHLLLRIATGGCS